MVTPCKGASAVRFIGNYCSVYQDFFVDVRGFEAFKFLNLSMISKLSRKSLPAVARAVSLRMTRLGCTSLSNRVTLVGERVARMWVEIDFAVVEWASYHAGHR